MAGQAGKGRLAAALLAPALFGALGLGLLHSLRAEFFLYLLGGCALAPWLLLGARPLASAGGLPFAPPRRETWRADLQLATLFGPFLLVGYLLARPFLGDPAAYLARLRALGLDLESPVAPIVLFLLLNPLLEEWWWRGQATPRCLAAFGPRAGLAVATAAFGLYHLVLLGAMYSWPIALVRSLLIAAAGLLWSLVAVRLGSWRAVYLAHLAADVVIVVILIVWVLPRGSAG